MNIIKAAIRYPVTTTVAVILLSLFGLIALKRVPIQLIPSVQDPEITVTTFWPGANPQEVEQEITDAQEEQLKSLQGLERMESNSTDGQSVITLTFRTGTDLDTALVRVSNKLDQVLSYPFDAEKPVLATANANNTPIAWFVLLPHGDNAFGGDITTFDTLMENVVKPELERVPGVATAQYFGGRPLEMQVIFDPAKLAARGVTVGQLRNALQRENNDVSSGDFAEGKRRYVVRLLGQFRSAADIENVVVAVRDGVPIYVRDIGRVELGYAKEVTRGYHNGTRVIIANVIRETGSNVLVVMDGVRDAMTTLNQGILAQNGLRLHQVYDETSYINSAIDLVQQSLVLGGILAIMVLLLFLRSGSSTLVIAVAIPISVVGTFLMMNLLGRTLNVVSLAGMAFAVGMVVDNSIVVLENIYRHRQLGKSRVQAAYTGATEVWGAILASTLTTIAVFVPILFVEEEAGQLFRDIAIAISCAVGLSLVVAMTVIPSLSARILRTAKTSGDASESKRHGGHRIRDGIADAVYWLCGTWPRQLATVLILTGLALGLSWWLLPKAEYLPTGNQNLLFGIVSPPPGYNLEQTGLFMDHYRDKLAYLWEADDEAAAAMPGGGIDSFFFVALNNQAFMGGQARDPVRVKELLGIFAEANSGIPGTFAFTVQAGLFTSFNEGRSIDIEISGPELTQLIAIGQQVFGLANQHLPGSQIRAIPDLDLGNPELQVIPDRRKAAELGMDSAELGYSLSALVDGTKAADYVHQGNEIDLRIKGEETFAHRTHLLDQMPIATPTGELVTLGNVATVNWTNGPTQVQRIERQRAVIIRVSPPETMPLQAAMDTVETQILAPLQAQGQVGGLYRTNLSGSADKLTQTAAALKWNLILALVITYLLLAALFESFLYPFVILFSVPLAALGGFLGLNLVSATIVYQPMDVLTMLGFIILIGTVVNNAILVVHQSLVHIREEAMAPREAVREATRIRIRPIFMSVSTSVFGMLPLVLFPGAGSELYRGLGSVVVGGLVVSTIFTLFLIPPLFSLCLAMRDKVVALLPVGTSDAAT